MIQMYGKFNEPRQTNTKTNGRVRMKLFDDVENCVPFFVNEDGFSWYLMECLTQSCTEENRFGYPPLAAKVFKVYDRESNPQSFVVVKDGGIIKDSQSYESICSYIEAMRMALA